MPCTRGAGVVCQRSQPQVDGRSPPPRGRMSADIPLGLLLVPLLAVPVVVIAERSRLPAVIGLLFTGWLVGPTALGLMDDPELIELLAEIGIALLLFTIGLESHFEMLWEIRRWLILGGGLVVVGTTVLGLGVALLFDASFSTALLIGLAISMSSSVLGLGLLQHSASLDAAHGRAALAVLLLQDVMLVPVLLLIPVLADGGSISLDSAGEILTSLGRAAVVLSLAAIASRLLIPLLASWVERSRSSELRILATVGVVLAIGAIVESFDVSFALGAFVAGLAISGTRLVHEYHDTVLPFRDVLTALFFIAVGLRMDLGLLFTAPLIVIAVLLVAVPLKGAVAAGTGRLMGLKWPEALLFAAVLAQTGELALIVILQAESANVVTGDLAGGVLLAAGLSIGLGAVVHPVVRRRVQAALESGVEGVVPEVGVVGDCVIIVGGGVAARRIADGLRVQQRPYRIIERNRDTVLALEEDGFTAVRGDASEPEVLLRQGIGEACALVSTVPDLLGALAVVKSARVARPDVRLILRARNHRDVPRLEAVNPAFISCDEDEVGTSLAFHVAEAVPGVEFVDLPGPHVHDEPVLERLARLGRILPPEDDGVRIIKGQPIDLELLGRRSHDDHDHVHREDVEHEQESE